MELNRKILLYPALVYLALFFCGKNMAQGFEGCTVRFGRRGCFYKVLTGVLVTCDGQGSEKLVPTNVPQDAVYMSLKNFKFDTLKRENFTQFKTVECLTITESGVKGLEYDTFADMEALQELVLTDTEMRNTHLAFANHPTFKNTLLTVSNSPAITQVAFNATQTLHQLQSLSFRSNGVDIVSPRIFSELRKLQRLDLANNKIKDLDWTQLSELGKLNQLFLEGNQMQTIPSYVHGEFFSVKQLTLAGNPFHCNCKLKWLKDFFDEAIDKLLDYKLVECASPEAKPMMEIDSSAFSCSRPSPPKVIFRELTREIYVVNCTSHADPAPNITLTLPDGRVVITPPSDDLSKLDTHTPDILSSPGGVICEAANSEGSSSSLAKLPPIASAFSDAHSHHVIHVTYFLMTSLIAMAAIL